MSRALAEIVRELETIRSGEDPLTDLLPQMRRLLDVESLGLYSVREHLDSWKFEHWHMSEIPSARIREGMIELFQRRDVPVLFYDIACPARGQRNRLIEATAMIDATQPGGWRETPLNREILSPLGLGVQKQHRILLCEGASLLGWFGSFHHRALTPLQSRTFLALGRAMRKHLRALRLVEDLPRGYAIVEAALRHIARPAFLLTDRGVLLIANESGNRMLADRSVRAALTDAFLGRASTIRFDFTRLVEGNRNVWLAIAATSSDATISLAVARARQRWALTDRQTEVLDHVVRGRANATTAAELKTSVRTVELHVSGLLERVGVDNRAALVATVLLA